MRNIQNEFREDEIRNLISDLDELFEQQRKGLSTREFNDFLTNESRYVQAIKDWLQRKGKSLPSDIEIESEARAGMRLAQAIVEQGKLRVSEEKIHDFRKEACKVIQNVEGHVSIGFAAAHGIYLLLSHYIPLNYQIPHSSLGFACLGEALVAFGIHRLCRDMKSKI
ncbi:MAG TPA: hypothetical protein VF644_19695 [Pyrinomonadaceae bacterium]|jgi:hypothetical protein